MRHSLNPLPLWDSFWSDTDTQMERSVALLHLPRLILLLPLPQTIFSPTMRAFTDVVPQQFWGLLSLFIVVLIARATQRKHDLRLRAGAMYWAGGHYLTLAVLYLQSEWRNLAGWFCLLICLMPLAVIARLSPGKKEGTPDAD